MEYFNSRRVANIGLVTALYVVITLAFSFMSYGMVQFRISEILILLCFFNKDHIISLTMGCLLANIFSSLGPIDVVVGTSATLISAFLIYKFRKTEGKNFIRLILCSLFPVVINGIFVGAELKFVSNLPFWSSAAYVALGEFVCITVVGTILVKAMSQNKQIMKIIMAGTEKRKF